MVSLIWDPYIELKAELSKDGERLHNSHHASAVWNSGSLTGNDIVRGENQQKESCQGDYYFFFQKKSIKVRFIMTLAPTRFISVI